MGQDLLLRLAACISALPLRQGMRFVDRMRLHPAARGEP